MLQLPSQDELNINFKQVFLPILEELEVKRLKLWNLVRFLYISGAVSVVLFIISEYQKNLLKIIFFTTAFLCFWLASSLQRPYKNDFKNKIIKPLLDSILPNSSFLPHSGLSEAEFFNSKLYNQEKSLFSFKSEDLIECNIENLNLKMSEVTLLKYTTKKKKSTEGVFSGLAGFTPLNSSVLGGELRFVPKKYTTKFNNLAIVKLESPRLAEIYNIYSNDQVFARFILNPAVMDYILDLHERFYQEITISITDQKLHFNWSHAVNLFEADITLKATSETQYYKFVNEILLIIKIIRQLKINRQSWGKVGVQ